MTIRKFVIISLSICFLLLTQHGCEFIDGVTGVKALKENVEETNKKLDEMTKQVQKLEDDAKKKETEVHDLVETVLWFSGISVSLALLLSPIRNLIRRVLFKTIQYTPRRFEKDKE